MDESNSDENAGRVTAEPGAGPAAASVPRRCCEGHRRPFARRSRQQRRARSVQRLHCAGGAVEEIHRLGLASTLRTDISAKSKQWLQGKGWWPLNAAWIVVWSGQE